MGYCMDMHGSDFTIPADKAAGALAAIQELDPNKNGSGGSWSGGIKKESWFSWVTTSEYKYATTVGEAMEAWRWELRQEPNGDWILDAFTGEKLGDDTILFNAIAPYVKPGSYIEMQGEDGSMWRWVFDGKTCKEIEAKISWED